jgi:hypothetical protein
VSLGRRQATTLGRRQDDDVWIEVGRWEAMGSPHLMEREGRHLDDEDQGRRRSPPGEKQRQERWGRRRATARHEDGRRRVARMSGGESQRGRAVARREGKRRGGAVRTSEAGCSRPGERTRIGSDGPVVVRSQTTTNVAQGEIDTGVVRPMENSGILGSQMSPKGTNGLPSPLISGYQVIQDADTIPCGHQQ